MIKKSKKWLTMFVFIMGMVMMSGLKINAATGPAELDVTGDYTVKADGNVYNSSDTDIDSVRIISGGSISFETNINGTHAIINGVMGLGSDNNAILNGVVTVPADAVSVSYSPDKELTTAFDLPQDTTFYVRGGSLRDTTASKEVVPVGTVLASGCKIIGVEPGGMAVNINDAGITVVFGEVFTLPEGGPYTVESADGGVRFTTPGEVLIQNAREESDSSDAHVHTYNWEKLTELTYTTDGYAEYRCSCGDVKDIEYLTAYSYCIEDSIRKINEAPAGYELIVDTAWWTTYPVSFMKAIMDRQDLTIILRFEYEHEQYEKVFAPGHVVDTSFEWYGSSWFIY